MLKHERGRPRDVSCLVRFCMRRTSPSANAPNRRETTAAGNPPPHFGWQKSPEQTREGEQEYGGLFGERPIRPSLIVPMHPKIPSITPLICGKSVSSYEGRSNVKTRQPEHTA